MFDRNDNVSKRIIITFKNQSVYSEGTIAFDIKRSGKWRVYVSNGLFGAERRTGYFSPRQLRITRKQLLQRVKNFVDEHSPFENQAPRERTEIDYFLSEFFDTTGNIHPDKLQQLSFHFNNEQNLAESTNIDIAQYWLNDVCTNKFLYSLGLLYWPTQLILATILAVAYYALYSTLSAIVALAALCAIIFLQSVILLSMINIFSKYFQFGLDSTQQAKINHVKSIINKLQTTEEALQNDMAEMRFNSTLQRNGQRNTLPLANAFVLGEGTQPEADHPENR